MLMLMLIVWTWTSTGVLPQIDYYTDKWAIPERVFEAIRTHETMCENPLTEYYNGTVEKLVVSMFLGAFKFGGTDVRVGRRSSVINRTNSFQEGFPQPPLQKPDSLTKRICDVDSQDCLHFIYKQLTTVSLEKINYVYGPDTYPGRNRRVITVRHKREYISPLKLFTFQATSMIVLCYWSILVDDPINEMDWSCRFPGKAFKQTIRSRCMLNAVCPNPCCGEKRVNDTNTECGQAGAEKCAALTKFPGSECTRREGHDVYRETSMSEFAASGPSFQCGCPESETWHSDYLACLDKDECLTRLHKCDPNTQYCVNRPKGYFCACRWGHRSVGRYLCKRKQLESLTEQTTADDVKEISDL